MFDRIGLTGELFREIRQEYKRQGRSISDMQTDLVEYQLNLEQQIVEEVITKKKDKDKKHKKDKKDKKHKKSNKSSSSKTSKRSNQGFVNRLSEKS